MIFAKVNDQNEVTDLINTKKELGDPWIEVNQGSVTLGQVYNDQTGLFEDPAE